MKSPKTGSIVRSTCGRDKDGVFAVIGTVVSEEGRQFLLISDGRHHPLENPKKKNSIHLQTMCESDEELASALEEGNLTNRRLADLLRTAQHQA